MKIHQFTCFGDNYGVLVHSEKTGETFSVDAPAADPVLAALKETGWKLTHILVTHHHGDHVEGIPAVKAATGCVVIGPAGDEIPGRDRIVKEGDRIAFGGETIEVIATPGHTLDMLNYFLPKEGVVFAGDTLFAMGCGRVFEGTHAMMWNSLTKLMALPADTKVYCGHEYTLSNGKFALTVDGDNPDLVARMAEVEKLRVAGKPTVPSVMSLELKTNPFLRAADPKIRAKLGMVHASDAEVFGELRERKNRG